MGMNAHLVVDAQSDLVQKVNGTAANVSDISQTHELWHGQEHEVFADAGYLGVQKRPNDPHGIHNPLLFGQLDFGTPQLCPKCLWMGRRTLRA